MIRSGVRRSQRPADRSEPSFAVAVWCSIVGLGLVLGADGLRAQAVECPPLRALAAESGYRERGNRCEGMFVSPISSGEFELVSLVRGGISFDLDLGGALAVTAPVEGDPLYVRAVAREPRVYYRMDAVLPADEALHWPVDAVLLPERLTADRIGIFGWILQGGDTVFVPLTVRGPGDESRGDSVEFITRPSFDADSVLWRITTGGKTSRWRLATRRARAWQVVPIWLPDGEEDEVRVRLQALHRRSGRWVTMAITVRRR